MTPTDPECPRVLVVEDNEATREAFSLVLGLGDQVVTASDGRAALEWLRTHARPCVIVLDLMMPIMDGYQFRREQRRDESLASIPVIVCTAAGERSIRREQLQAAGYLAKPVDPLALLDAVRAQCRQTC
jgi:CheY-like chemotaxis protein